MQHTSPMRYAVGVAIVVEIAMPEERGLTRGGTDPNAAPNPYGMEEGWTKPRQSKRPALDRSQIQCR